jgi:hypothetical protein
MKSELEVVAGFMVVPENPTIVLSIGAVQNDPAAGRICKGVLVGRNCDSVPRHWRAGTSFF